MQLTVLKQPRRQVRPEPLSPRDQRLARDLADALRQAIEGEVRFDDGSRALYATDASNYRQVPIGVVIPRTIEDVIAAVCVCRDFAAPLFSRGGGTSLAGQCCNAAVVIDHSKYLRRVLRVDSSERLATVEAGCVLDDLNAKCHEHGLIFAPDPATHSHNCLGGMLGNNSCGIHSLLAACHGFGLRTSDNTHQLDIITAQGDRMTVGATSPDELEQIIDRGGAQSEIYRRLREFVDRYADDIRTGYPQIPRRVSGYNLDALLPENGFHVARALVGSESTLVTILHGTQHVVPNPAYRTLVVLGYPDVFHAADHLMEVLESNPIALEGIDDLLFEWIRRKGNQTADLRLMPPGNGFLWVEFGGESKAESHQRAHDLIARLKRSSEAPSWKIFDDPAEALRVWKVRESGLGATAWVPGIPDTWPGFEDSAVAPQDVGNYLRDLKRLFRKYNYTTSLYGHFGQGCIHCRIPFDLYTAQGIENYRTFMDEATDLVVRYGGSFSGEHGDGQARAQFLPKMFTPSLMQAMREFKSIWDPQWRMNPGKVIEPYSITSNLRLGVDYNPPRVETHFRFPNDRNSMARAVLRCVGVGECRREEHGVMCPSYMVTHEEKHSTRGRARLLWEMLNGHLRHEGFQSQAVKESLDLCLACKGCKSDCPVNVDMATYKAEFYSHHYRDRLHPRQHYAFGWIGIWAALAGKIPTLVNFFTQAPLLRDISKFLAGMARPRRVPQFAPQSFQRWFARRKPRNVGAQSVVIWPDTFNNYFHPQVAKAAVEVLEDAGFHVRVPGQSLCCGRPLYDYGFLDMAQRWLVQILNALKPDIEAGTPIVVLEPSCCAVFRDELTNMMPNSQHARRLKAQTFLLSEFLEQKAPHYRLPKLRRKAIVQTHCHHHAVMGASDEQKTLTRMGLDFEILDSGCCGMAGAFGFEPGERYDVSIKCGERVLLPAVRNADADTFIIADGFSCREQIMQSTDREALHLSQVLQLAQHTGEHGPQSPRSQRPETVFMQHRAAAQRRANFRTAALVGAAGLGLAAFAAWRASSRRAELQQRQRRTATRPSIRHFQRSTS